MSSENSEKEKQVLAFFTYAGLGVFMVVVVVIIYYTSNKKSAPTPLPTEILEMPEVKILTSEEVSNERFVLERVNEINEREKAGISITDDAPKKKPVEEIVVNTPPKPADPVVVEKIKEEQKAKDPAVPRADAAPNGANKSPASKPFSDFKNVSDSSSMVTKSISGYVIKFNFEHNFLVIEKDGGGNASVRVDNKTEFKINGKNITVNDLKIGDKISASGKGYDFTDEILAETVYLTGAINFY